MTQTDTPTPEDPLRYYKFSGNANMRKKKHAFVDIYNKFLYNVSYACRQVGIGRKTYYRWIEDDPEFRTACEDTEEGIKDKAETILQQLLNEKDPRCTIFFLKTKCKDRGYVERTESINTEKVDLSGPSLQEKLDRLRKLSPEERIKFGEIMGWNVDSQKTKA